MSDAPLLLTLIVPCELEESATDALLARPDLISGFTSVPAEGHGSSLKLVEADELVCGHVRRKRLDLVCVDHARADAILALLSSQFAGANLYYWITPVLAHGRLA